ncbi:leucine-rich repeat neuronal protein 4 [Sarcophilus harrisii]|uniref:Leucine rich repeat neuronal 4 n=1 Tax=Sarcophilus harrisii TaxID=9305 RepID=G3W8W6_SARHA|nr:leucine-rich repeat neuronal protein 4 [Sarcophilus harrisii]
MLYLLLLTMMELRWAAPESPLSMEGVAVPKAIATLFQVTELGPQEDKLNFSSSSCKEFNKTTVATLFLVNRNLENFPPCLPKTLQSLDLSSNKLKELRDQDLRDLSSLKVLILRNNLIQELHWGGTPVFESLETLDLSYNKLSSMPSCQTMMLQNLTELSLVGNPILEIQPGAFSCFPSLRLLNLSATLLGKNDQGGIKESAFAQRILNEAGEKIPMQTMEVLDLSGTFLPEIQLGWIRDIPNLRSLYLKKMARLKSLDGEIFKATPNLRVLDCQDSQALSLVKTKIFEDTPHLQSLLFQNCNLSSFKPWSLDSSQVIFINLYGNPLTCSCDLSWLLSNTEKMVLSRSNDTMCTPVADPNSTFSSSLSLSQLYNKCYSKRNSTFMTSSPSLESSANNSSKPLNGSNQPVTLASPSFHKTEPTAFPALGTPNVTKENSIPSKKATFTTLKFVLPTQSVGRIAIIPTTVPSVGPDDVTIPPRIGKTAPTKLRKENTIRKNFFNQSSIEPGISLTTSNSTPFPKQHPRIPTLPHTISTPRTNERAQTTGGHQPSASIAGIPIYMLDDYSYEEEEDRKELVKQDIPCDYHPCKHLQTPCDILQKSSRCRCPGLSGEDTIPDPPKLQEVSETTDTSALIRWCAPNSVVHMYQLIYHPEDRAEKQTVLREIHTIAREHPLHGLSPSTTYNVCVLASNKAGLSLTRTSEWRKACTTFTTKPSFLFIFAGLCSTSGLLLLSTFILSVCLYKKCKTRHAEQYDTHLVSYKNPAFDYPLKLQTFKS